MMSMADKKITKREMYARVLSRLTDADEKAFIEREMELLAKKNATKSTKPTATQVANAGIKDSVLTAMVENHLYTVSELMKLIDTDVSNQKMSALVRQMIAEGTVERIEDKRKAYFRKAVAVANEGV